MTSPTQGEHAQTEALIEIAREIEALKRPCGMDPESAIAVQNGRYMSLSYKVRALAAQVAARPASPVAQADWTKPTTVAQRLGDALQLLCGGKRPADAMVLSWLDHSSEDLQSFCCDHGPSGAQGIALIDAAMVLVDQPTEITTIDNPGRDHEHRAKTEHIPAVVLENGAESNMTGGAVGDVDLVARGMGWADCEVLMREACAQAGVEWGEEKQPQNIAINVMMRLANAAHKAGFTLGKERMAAASHGQAPAGATDPQLLKFYGVSTDAELIAAQARHIERLQAKLPQTPSLAPQRVREG